MAEQLPRWTDWARELQALAQAGLEYSPDPYDRERFQRIREIAALIICPKMNIKPFLSEIT